jgi:hypothetical protein
MIDMPKAFPIEFRRDVVAVARKGQAPPSQIAKDFGISESCLHRWPDGRVPASTVAAVRHCRLVRPSRDGQTILARTSNRRE